MYMSCCRADPVPEILAKVKINVHKSACCCTAFNREDCKQSKCPSVGVHSISDVVSFKRTTRQPWNQ